MVDKKVSKKDVDVKPAARAAAEDSFTIVNISGEEYKKYDSDGRLENTGA